MTTTATTPATITYAPVTTTTPQDEGLRSLFFSPWRRNSHGRSAESADRFRSVCNRAAIHARFQFSGQLVTDSCTHTQFDQVYFRALESVSDENTRYAIIAAASNIPAGFQRLAENYVYADKALQAFVDDCAAVFPTIREEARNLRPQERFESLFLREEHGTTRSGLLPLPQVDALMEVGLGSMPNIYMRGLAIMMQKQREKQNPPPPPPVYMPPPFVVPSLTVTPAWKGGLLPRPVAMSLLPTPSQQLAAVYNAANVVPAQQPEPGSAVLSAVTTVSSKSGSANTTAAANSSAQPPDGRGPPMPWLLRDMRMDDYWDFLNDLSLTDEEYEDMYRFPVVPGDPRVVRWYIGPPTLLEHQYNGYPFHYSGSRSLPADSTLREWVRIHHAFVSGNAEKYLALARRIKIVARFAPLLARMILQLPVPAGSHTALEIAAQQHFPIPSNIGVKPAPVYYEPWDGFGFFYAVPNPTTSEESGPVYVNVDYENYIPLVLRNLPLSDIRLQAAEHRRKTEEQRGDSVSEEMLVDAQDEQAHNSGDAEMSGTPEDAEKEDLGAEDPK
ncbi:uncharacterized protein LOC129592387 [Paramacrobiotus metropolitanus]|uniref:uncharacterized protein LOC129592387 n=1 Tax=Paramacrobiotus metropolitanus TaxID=2943436 RepID=UPI00244635A7|nr:uncharacterized protein LOC129592387 [Paramacrobiotus metropolitanus]